MARFRPVAELRLEQIQEKWIPVFRSDLRLTKERGAFSRSERIVRTLLAEGTASPALRQIEVEVQGVVGVAAGTKHGLERAAGGAADL